MTGGTVCRHGTMGVCVHCLSEAARGKSEAVADTAKRAAIAALDLARERYGDPAEMPYAAYDVLAEIEAGLLVWDGAAWRARGGR